MHYKVITPLLHNSIILLGNFLFPQIVKSLVYQGFQSVYSDEYCRGEICGQYERFFNSQLCMGVAIVFLNMYPRLPFQTKHLNH